MRGCRSTRPDLRPPTQPPLSPPPPCCRPARPPAGRGAPNACVLVSSRRLSRIYLTFATATCRTPRSPSVASPARTAQGGRRRPPASPPARPPPLPSGAGMCRRSVAFFCPCRFEPCERPAFLFPPLAAAALPVERVRVCVRGAAASAGGERVCCVRPQPPPPRGPRRRHLVPLLQRLRRASLAPFDSRRRSGPGGGERLARGGGPCARTN